MKIEFFGTTIRTGKDCIGEPEQVEMPEQQAARIKEYRDYKLERLTQPSSEEGKHLYWSRVSWYQAPFKIIESFSHWLNCREVWYSKTGVRHVTYSITKKGD